MTGTQTRNIASTVVLIAFGLGIIALSTAINDRTSELAYEKLTPSVDQISIKRITYDTWTVEATFIGLTSEEITPTIEAYVSFRRDPIPKEDSIYGALINRSNRRFTWMLTPEEWEKGGNISSPCLRIRATTLDSEGHEHKISSPFIDFSNTQLHYCN